MLVLSFNHICAMLWLDINLGTTKGVCCNKHCGLKKVTVKSISWLETCSSDQLVARALLWAAWSPGQFKCSEVLLKSQKKLREPLIAQTEP